MFLLLPLEHIQLLLEMVVVEHTGSGGNAVNGQDTTFALTIRTFPISGGGGGGSNPPGQNAGGSGGGGCGHGSQDQVVPTVASPGWNFTYRSGLSSVAGNASTQDGAMSGGGGGAGGVGGAGNPGPWWWTWWIWWYWSTQIILQLVYGIITMLVVAAGGAHPGRQNANGGQGGGGDWWSPLGI